MKWRSWYLPSIHCPSSSLAKLPIGVACYVARSRQVFIKHSAIAFHRNIFGRHPDHLSVP